MRKQAQFSYALAMEVLSYMFGNVFYFTFHSVIQSSFTLFSIINGGESISCLWKMEQSTFEETSRVSLCLGNTSRFFPLLTSLCSATFCCFFPLRLRYVHGSGPTLIILLTNFPAWPSFLSSLLEILVLMYCIWREIHLSHRVTKPLSSRTGRKFNYVLCDCVSPLGCPILFFVSSMKRSVSYKYVHLCDCHCVTSWLEIFLLKRGFSCGQTIIITKPKNCHWQDMYYS